MEFQAEHDVKSRAKAECHHGKTYTQVMFMKEHFEFIGQVGNANKSADKE
jgi:hypothetical protein